MLSEPKKLKHMYSMNSLRSKKPANPKKKIKKFVKKSPSQTKKSPRKRRRKKKKMIPLPKLSRAEFKEVEFNQICTEINLSKEKITPDIMNLINLFIDTPLDPGWNSEINETKTIYYHYQPDNFSTKNHPHISRLIACIIQYTELSDQRKIEVGELHTNKAVEMIKQMRDAKLTAKALKGIKKFTKKMTRQFTTLNTNNSVNEKDEIPKSKKKDKKNDSTQISKEKNQRKGDKKDKAQKAEKDLKKEKDELKASLQKGHFVENLLSKDIKMKMNTNKHSGNNIKLRVLDTRKRKAIENNLHEINKVEIAQHELFYKYSENYYRKILGFPLKKIPKKILKSKEYRSIRVERALEIFYKLGLKPVDSWLFHHAMLLDALPLPPEIIEDSNKGKLRYFFDGKILNNIFKPGLFYIQKNIEFLKKKNKDRILLAPKFNFIDTLGRGYSVNLEELYKKWLNKPKKRKYLEYTAEEREEEDMFAQKLTYKEIKGDFNNRILTIMARDYGKPPPIIVSVSGNKNPDLKNKIISTNIKDVHFIHLMKQLKLDLETDMHLMYPIEEFVRRKEENTTWIFKIRPDGEKVWVNSYDSMVAFEYPYLKDLTKEIEKFRDKYNLSSLIGRTKRGGLLEHILLDFRNGIPLIEKCRRRVLRVFEKYIHPTTEVNNKPKTLYKDVELQRTVLNLVLRCDLSMHDFIHLIFFCEFDLERTQKQMKKIKQKEDQVFLRGQRPDRALLEKYNLVRPMISGGNIKGVAKFIAMRQLATRNTFSRRDSIRTTMTRKGGSLQRRRTRFLDEPMTVEDLGPIENYLHLLDPILREEIKKTENPGENILNTIKTMEELDSVARECDKILDNAHTMGEHNLNHMIKNLAKIYQKLELESKNFPVAKLQKLKKLKDRAIEKRNQMKKNKLKMSKALIGYLNKALEYNLLDSLPRVTRIKNIHWDSDKTSKASIKSNKDLNLGIPTNRKMKRRKSVMAKIGKGNEFVTVFMDRINSRGSDILYDEDEKSHKKSKGKSRMSIYDKMSKNGKGKQISKDSEDEKEEGKVFSGFSAFNNFLVERRLKTQSDENINDNEEEVKGKSNPVLPSNIEISKIDKLATEDPKLLEEIIKKDTKMTDEDKEIFLKNLKIYSQLKKSTEEDLSSSVEEEDDKNIQKETSKTKVFVPEKTLFENLGRIGMANVNDFGFGIEQRKKKYYEKSSSKSKIESKSKLNYSKISKEKTRKKSRIEIEESGESFIDPLYSENKIFRIEDIVKKSREKTFQMSEKKELTNVRSLLSPATSGFERSSSKHRKSQDLEFIQIKGIKSQRKITHNNNIKSKINIAENNHEMENNEKGFKNLIEARKWISTLNSERTQKSQLASTNREKTVLNNYYQKLADGFRDQNIFRKNISLILEKKSKKEEEREKKMENSNKKNRRVFTRLHQYIPFKMIQEKDLKARVEVFMMIWLSENLNLSDEKVQEYFENEEKRRCFFSLNDNVFEFLIEAIMKDPILSKKATSFIFKKYEDEAQSIKKLLNDRKEAKDRKQTVKFLKNKNDKFMKSSFKFKDEIEIKNNSGVKSEKFLKNDIISKGLRKVRPRNLFNLGKTNSYFFLTEASTKKLPKVTIAGSLKIKRKIKRNAFNSTSSNFRKKKMFKQASMTAGVFFTKKELPGTVRKHYTKKKNRENQSSMPSLRSTKTGIFLSSRVRFMDTGTGMTSKKFKRLCDKYGEPILVHRGVLNTFDEKIKLKVSSLEMINEVSTFLGIKKNGKYIHPDLTWVSVFIVLHYHQYIKIFQEKSKNWEKELSYFIKILDIQIERKKQFRDEYFGVHKFDGVSVSFSKIEKGLSWIRVYNNARRLFLHYNFKSNEFLADVPRFDIELLKKYFNYVK